MKTFLAIFAVVILAFGASILYYRGDFGTSKPKTESQGSQNNQPSDNSSPEKPQSFNITKSPNANSADKVLAETTAAVKYVSLEIKQTPSGVIKVGQSFNFLVLAREKGGNKASVKAKWSLSDTKVGALDKKESEEVVFTPKKAGKVKLTVNYQDLTASLNLVITADTAVLGSTTGNNTGVGSTKPAQIIVTPIEIRLYDSFGDRFKVGDSRQYNAQVFYSDNSLKNLDVTWSLDPSDLGSLDRTQGPSVNFKAGRSGSGNLKVTFGNLSSSLYIQVN